MQVRLDHVGKKFQHEWIFREVSFLFEENRTYALTGPNGSGKSTLLMLISALVPPSRGSLTYRQAGRSVADEAVYRRLTLAAPYQELVEEFTLQELLDFHFTLKPPVTGQSVSTILAKMRLENARNKYIYQFSSGMKQRLKLGLALFSESQMILLDEPCANLDAENTRWYREEIQQVLGQRLIIIASNQSYEYDFCDQILDIVRFK